MAGDDGDRRHDPSHGRGARRRAGRRAARIRDRAGRRRRRRLRARGRDRGRAPRRRARAGRAALRAAARGGRDVRREDRARRTASSTPTRRRRSSSTASARCRRTSARVSATSSSGARGWGRTARSSRSRCSPRAAAAWRTTPTCEAADEDLVARRRRCGARAPEPDERGEDPPARRAARPRAGLARRSTSPPAAAGRRSCSRGSSGAGSPASSARPSSSPTRGSASQQAGLEDRIELVEADGATFELGRYDAALCIGATFVYGGLVPTLERLRPAAPLARGRRAVLAHLAAAARA